VRETQTCWLRWTLICSVVGCRVAVYFFLVVKIIALKGRGCTMYKLMYRSWYPSTAVYTRCSLILVKKLLLLFVVRVVAVFVRSRSLVASLRSRTY
jgi:hypothetical protein